ncbi:hypothetical protein RN629_03975 [Sphingomonadaceae bacterium jetA1]|uniref:hypothetical protein n=1 Tax=Facivitalis istanbulensis TaxID=3075838 RepID=UPI00346EEEEE
MTKVGFAILALSLTSPVQAQTTKAQDNRDLTAMFEADQAIRQSIDPAKPIDISFVRRMIAEDNARRAAVRVMLDQNRLATAEDYYHAAFVLQHGSSAGDYLLAHTLALAAAARGKKDASWIAAATLDRYLMKIGQPQIYGTQYIRSKESGPTMAPYDRNLIPDSLRRALDVPVQAEQVQELDAMKTSSPKP